jgi:glutamine phosphoribosylpyrophosphate amidotransferase
MLFANRADAGRALAERLQAYAGRSDTILVALPRGGVPVAFEVAQALKIPLDSSWPCPSAHRIAVKGSRQMRMKPFA